MGVSVVDISRFLLDFWWTSVGGMRFFLPIKGFPDTPAALAALHMQLFMLRPAGDECFLQFRIVARKQGVGRAMPDESVAFWRLDVWCRVALGHLRAKITRHARMMDHIEG